MVLPTLQILWMPKCGQDRHNSEFCNFATRIVHLDPCRIEHQGEQQKFFSRKSANQHYPKERIMGSDADRPVKQTEKGSYIPRQTDSILCHGEKPECNLATGEIGGITMDRQGVAVIVWNDGRQI